MPLRRPNHPPACGLTAAHMLPSVWSSFMSPLWMVDVQDWDATQQETSRCVTCRSFLPVSCYLVVRPRKLRITRMLVRTLGRRVSGCRQIHQGKPRVAGVTPPNIRAPILTLRRSRAVEARAQLTTTTVSTTCHRRVSNRQPSRRRRTRPCGAFLPLSTYYVGALQLMGEREWPTQ
jgi:hypothetical protein